MAHVLFNALNCTRILAGWLKQRGVYKRIRGIPPPQMPLDGSYPESQAWSCGAAPIGGLVALRTGCQLCCALLITELAASTTVLARCQLYGTWPALHALLNPVFTLTCLIYQNVSAFPQTAARQSGGVRTIRHFTKLQPAALLSANRKQREAIGST